MGLRMGMGLIFVHKNFTTTRIYKMWRLDFVRLCNKNRIVVVKVLQNVTGKGCRTNRCKCFKARQICNSR